VAAQITESPDAEAPGAAVLDIAAQAVESIESEAAATAALADAQHFGIALNRPFEPGMQVTLTGLGNRLDGKEAIVTAIGKGKRENQLFIQCEKKFYRIQKENATLDTSTPYGYGIFKTGMRVRLTGSSDIEGKEAMITGVRKKHLFALIDGRQRRIQPENAILVTAPLTKNDRARSLVRLDHGRVLEVFTFNEKGPLGMRLDGKLINGFAIVWVAAVVPGSQAAHVGIPVGAVIRLVATQDVTRVTSMKQVRQAIAHAKRPLEITVAVPPRPDVYEYVRDTLDTALSVAPSTGQLLLGDLPLGSWEITEAGWQLPAARLEAEMRERGRIEAEAKRVAAAEARAAKARVEKAEAERIEAEWRAAEEEARLAEEVRLAGIETERLAAEAVVRKRERAIVTVQSTQRGKRDREVAAELRQETLELKREALALALQQGTRAKKARAKLATTKELEAQRSKETLGDFTARQIVSSRAREGGVFTATALLLFASGQGAGKREIRAPPESAIYLLNKGLQARMLGKSVKKAEQAWLAVEEAFEREVAVKLDSNEILAC